VRQGKERLGTSGEDGGLVIRWKWQGSFGWLWVVAEAWEKKSCVGRKRVKLGLYVQRVEEDKTVFVFAFVKDVVWV